MNLALEARSHRPVTNLGQLLARLHLDGILLAGLAGIMAIGLLGIYSAKGQQLPEVTGQMVRMLVALTAMLALAQVNPVWLRRAAPFAYLAGVALLAMVLLAGEVGKGAQRWLNFGIRFQPSEVMKLAVPIALCALLHERVLPPCFLMLVLMLTLIGVLVLMIAVQPDLGTAILITLSGVAVIFLAGIARGWIIAGFALGLAALPALWFVMHDYQRSRVLTMFNPDSDPLGAGYHIIQSKIAIGSGGVFGKGWLNGTQGQLEFLPERSTDFIFAVIGEEFGLLGALLLLLLYLVVTTRGLVIAALAQDTFSRLLAGALSVTFFVYVLVNTAMVMGLLPVVGVPLPLVSAGGTSMVTLLAGFGILMSIHTHRKLVTR